MIEARGLTKYYGDVLAVEDVDFTVHPGKVTGFLGPNGAGKTTTIRMILGLASPTRGTVTVAGRRYADLPAPMRVIGALLDARDVNGNRRAYQHLACLAHSNGISRRRVEEVLELVGLEPVRRRRAGKLSLGMAQRLGIAAALLGDPAVLIFDEPVNGLDPEGIVWIRNLMRRLADEGRTVLVSSHLMSEMALTADHLIVIGQGRLMADTSMAEFTRASMRQKVVVRTPDAEILTGFLTQAGATTTLGCTGELEVTGLDRETIGMLAAAEGIVLYELKTCGVSLEDAYMRLTRRSVEFRAGQGGPR